MNLKTSDESSSIVNKGSGLGCSTVKEIGKRSTFTTILKAILIPTQDTEASPNTDRNSTQRGNETRLVLVGVGGCIGGATGPKATALAPKTTTLQIRTTTKVPEAQATTTMARGTTEPSRAIASTTTTTVTIGTIRGKATTMATTQLRTQYLSRQTP